MKTTLFGLLAAVAVSLVATVAGAAEVATPAVYKKVIGQSTANVAPGAPSAVAQTEITPVGWRRYYGPYGVYRPYPVYRPYAVYRPYPVYNSPYVYPYGGVYAPYSAPYGAYYRGYYW
jgi:hypothetical protein